jgi:hypothetical protein
MQHPNSLETRWLIGSRPKYPNGRVRTLNAHNQQFPSADYNVIQNGPDNWLGVLWFEDPNLSCVYLSCAAFHHLGGIHKQPIERMSACPAVAIGETHTLSNHERQGECRFEHVTVVLR